MMKKLISHSSLLIILLAGLLALSAHAADTVTLLSGVNATGPGNAVAIGSGVYKTWACDITMTGSPWAVTVRIEGNQGGALFDPTGMATHTCTSDQLAAGICSFSIADSPVTNMRANVLTLEQDVEVPTVTVKCTGVK